MREYLREADLPTMWCPGCGNGIILGTLLRSFSSLGLDRREIVAVSGIGCFGKTDDYMNTNALHGTHGRALAYATGVKAANPELTVVALMGDGDAATIGGNHLIHSARRNIGVTAIVANNFNYGMTGGQYSATTPCRGYTSTSPYGNPEEDFDLCRLVEAAGGSYVARTSVFHVRELARCLERALETPGFALVEVFSSCPVYFGRYNRIGGPVELMRHWQKTMVTARKWETMDPSQREECVLRGELVKRAAPGFSERYREIQRAAAGGEGDA